jgi:hypothetical protein
MDAHPPPLNLISYTLTKAINPNPDSVVWENMPVCVRLLADAEDIRHWAVQEATDILQADKSDLSDEEIQALNEIGSRSKTKAQRKVYLTLSLLLRRNVRLVVVYCYQT